MKILFTGRGTSGSFQIRAQQLGNALGAEIQPNATRTDADVVVIVKRVNDATLRAVGGRKIVWDALDSWPQGGIEQGNDWNQAQALNWLDREMVRIKPDAVIAATKAMAEDLKPFGLPVLWLKHHHRPGIARNSLRERVCSVGYEGAAGYLNGWQSAIEAQCARIGANFVTNPSRLCDVDVILALRGSKGYAPRHWKSGVKLANAHASGTPWIGCRERGYEEISTGAEYWADTPAELAVAFDWLESQSTREQVADRFAQAAYSVEQAAADLSRFLHGL